MRFSIITVNYNNRKGLQRTIDSVICQTWKDYEWIIIDGGSTDGSKELLVQYQQHFAYWCSEPDKGIYHAMNKGVAKASGEYVNFMNSGDVFYDENVLQKIDDIHSDADIILGRSVRMDNQKLVNPYDGNMLMQLYYRSISHQGAFIRRVLLNQFPYDEKLKIVSDWKFWLQVIIWGEVKVDITPILVAKNDMNGISAGMSTLHACEREMVRNEFFPPLLRKELEDYQQVKRSPYFKCGEYLHNNCHLFFAIGLRILKLFVAIHKLFFNVFCRKDR